MLILKSTNFIIVSIVFFANFSFQRNIQNEIYTRTEETNLKHIET